jgi:predicted small lipoprotein YifL
MLAALALAAAIASACGQKGPLKLPDPAAPKPEQPARPPAAP